MAISLTKSAADRVSTYLQKRGAGIGLRLGVTKTGCSGYSYVINYADTVEGEDVVFEDRGVTIVVDPDTKEVVIATNSIGAAEDEIFRASITPCNGRLYLRSDQRLYCIGKR